MNSRLERYLQLIRNSQLFLALRGHWALATAVVFCLVGQTILTLAQPWPVRVIIDYVVKSPTISHDFRPTGGVMELAAARISQFFTSPDVRFLLGYLTILLGIYLLNAFLLYLQNLALARLSQQVILAVRRNLFSHLMFLPQRFFDGARTGDLTSRISKDTAHIQDVLEALLIVSIRSFPLVLGILIVSFVMDWSFALTLVFVVPMACWANALFMQRAREAVKGQMRIEGALAANVQEAFYNHRAVTVLSVENKMIGDFLTGGQESAVQGVKAGRLQGMLTASMDTLVGVTSMVVILVGALRILHGDLTIGQLTIFIAYVNSLFKPVREIAKFTNRLAKSASALERIEEVMQLRPLDKECRRTQQLGKKLALKGRIELERVTFGYHKDRPVLSDFSLIIEEGQRVALVGDSGNGKSTILHLIMKLYSPQQGTVRIDGLDISALACSSLRTQLAIVLQDSHLFNLSIRGNIAMARPGATELEVARAARAAGADEFIRKLPQGYRTHLGEGGAGLSGGQKRRIAIARAILRDAPIVLLDEPTTGLDPISEQKVSEALKSLTKGKTTIVVTHQLKTVAEMDRIVVLSQGEIAESGKHQELLNRNGVYKMLWDAQQSRESSVPFGL